MSGVSGVPGMTREGIVFDMDTPAGRAMEAEPAAQRAVADVRRGGSTEAAERALADLEDAVRGLPAGQAARYQATIRELATAIGESRVSDARSQRSSRRSNDPIAAALRGGTRRFAPSLLSQARRNPRAMRALSRVSEDQLVARLERNGATPEAARREVSELREGLVRLFHDQVKAEGRQIMRAAEPQFREAAAGIGPAFERFVEMLADGRSGDLIERLRMGGAPEEAARLRSMLDAEMTNPSLREQHAPEKRRLLTVALTRVARAIAEHNDSVSAFDADFGDAYRAFPSAMRAVARRSGIELDGNEGGLLSAAVREHVEHTEHEHHIAHVVGHIVTAGAVALVSAGLGLLALLVNTGAQATMASDRRTQTALAGVRAAGGAGDAGAVREQEAADAVADTVAAAELAMQAGLAVGAASSGGSHMAGAGTAERAMEGLADAANGIVAIGSTETATSE